MKTPVGKLSSIARRIFSNDIKTLHSAGFVEDDLSITAKGRNRLLAILLEEHMDALVVEAKEEIAEKNGD